MSTEHTLRAWLDGAWNDHPDAPRRVADELLARASALPDDAVGAEAVRLGEHVLLAHLADVPGLEALLAALPPGAAALVPSVQRARWALATLDGSPAPAIADAPRWRALHSVVMVLVSRGELAAARDRLFADEAAAAAHADPDARKAYAATAHNTASDLRAGPRGAGRDALMLDAARLERRAWMAAGGTWMNEERADYQLAMCHAVAGLGGEAVVHAQRCLATCEANDADAAERFFAHECNVHACRAAGDPAAAAMHRTRMAALLETIEDAGMKDWCAATLAGTPA